MVIKKPVKKDSKSNIDDFAEAEEKIEDTNSARSAIVFCDRCKTKMVITGGGRSGTDFKCPACGRQDTRVI